MSLTITNAGNSVTPSVGHISSGGQVIRVRPTLTDGDLMDANDVAIEPTAIPNAVNKLGGTSKLVALSILDYDKENKDMDIVFMQKGTKLGNVDAAVSISDSDMKAAGYLGLLSVDWSESTTSLQNVDVFTVDTTAQTANIIKLPMLLQAELNRTDVYFTIVVRENSTWTAVDDLELVFHIEYL